MTLHARLAIALAAAALSASGCHSCRDNAPFPREDSPEQSIANLRHFAQEECWGEAYDLLSARTRDEYGRIEWRLGAPGAEVPGTDIKIRDLILGGTPSKDVVLQADDTRTEERMWYFSDEREGGAQRCRFYQILMLRETAELDDGPAPQWRFGLQDQIDRNIPLCAE